MTSSRRGEPTPGEPRLPTAAQLLLTAERIEQLELIRAPGQAPLLELSRHRDQPLADRGEILAGGTAAPRVGAGAAVGEDAPGEHEPFLVRRPQLDERGDVVLVEQSRREVELRLDVRFVAVRADVRGLALRPEQQSDRLGEDGFAGARLACDRVQPRCKGELSLVDEDEILDAEPAQHLPPAMVGRAEARHHRSHLERGHDRGRDGVDPARLGPLLPARHRRDGRGAHHSMPD